MTVELHLIFIAIELLLFVGVLWLYLKQRRQTGKSSTSSSTKFTSNDYADYLKSNTWEELRQQATTRANQQCELCKGPYEIVHHIKHPQAYEEDDLSNLLVMCAICYGKLHGSSNQQGIAEKTVQPVLKQVETAVQLSLFNQKSVPSVKSRPQNFLRAYGSRVFSEEVINSGGAFFFDVYSTSKPERMLVIVEDRAKGYKPFGHYHLSIPEPNVSEFDKCFDETLNTLRKLTTKDKKDLFTKKVVAHNTSYFIDAKMASNGRSYFKITQSKKTEQDKFERSYIMMFEEDFDLFAAGLKKAISFLLQAEVT